MAQLYKMIPMIDAGDLPQEVEDYCADNEISTHYDSGIACVDIKEKDNPLLNWLKAQGFKPTDKYQYIAVHGT